MPGTVPAARAAVTPFLSAARRSPLAARCSPFAVRRSPLDLRCSPLAVRRPTSAARRRPVRGNRAPHLLWQKTVGAVAVLDAQASGWVEP